MAVAGVKCHCCQCVRQLAGALILLLLPPLLFLPILLLRFIHCTQMENISNFLKACRAVGVAEYSLFETVDLYEGKDLGLVVRCLVRD